MSLPIVECTRRREKCPRFALAKYVFDVADVIGRRRAVTRSLVTRTLSVVNLHLVIQILVGEGLAVVEASHSSPNRRH